MNFPKETHAPKIVAKQPEISTTGICAQTSVQGNVVSTEIYVTYVAELNHVLEQYNMPTSPWRMLTENKKESACSSLELSGSLGSGWEMH